MNRALSLSTALVAGCLLLPACDAHPTGRGSEAAGGVRLDLSTVHRATDGIATAIDSLELRVVATAGDTLRLGRRLVPLPPSVSFDLRLRDGRYRFEVEILSDNGQTLYFGERDVTIDRDGFAVDVPVLQYESILCAVPDTLRVTDQGGNLSLCQLAVPGTRPLEWSVVEVTPTIPLNQCTSSAVPCLNVVPMSGTLRAGDPAPLISLRPTTATPRVPYTLRIHSPLGSVRVVVIPLAP
jgi:hypothetical protein